MLHGHLRARRRALVSRARRRGISARICCRTTWSASRRASRSVSSTFPRLGDAGIQQGGQWALHVRAGRQSAGRTGHGACKNFWVACGVMAGFSQGGGVGLALSQLDGRRRSGRRRLGHGRGALRGLGDAGLHQRQGARELFAPLPHPLSRTRSWTPPGRCAPRRSTRSCGRACGVRRLLRARASAVVRAQRREAARGNELRRSNAHRARGAECRAVREAVGLLEISNYGKFEVTRRRAPPSGCRAIMANRVPAVGRIALSPMLNERGKLIGDFTMCRVAERALLPDRHLCRGNLLPALVRAAPAARRRQRARRARWSTWACRSPGPIARAAAGPGARGSVDRGLPVHVVPAHGGRHGARRYVGRVSFTGDLGYEIWVTTDYQRALYDAAQGRPASLRTRSCSAGAR